MGKQVPYAILQLGNEAKSHYNDGWTMAAAKEQLLSIRDYINRLFPEVKSKKNNG